MYIRDAHEEAHIQNDYRIHMTFMAHKSERNIQSQSIAGLQ